jgi:hypothetical protein
MLKWGIAIAIIATVLVAIYFLYSNMVKAQQYQTALQEYEKGLLTQQQLAAKYDSFFGNTWGFNVFTPSNFNPGQASYGAAPGKQFTISWNSIAGMF